MPAGRRTDQTSESVSPKPVSPNHARILYMATLPLAEVRANLSKLIEEAVRTHGRIEVTRQAAPQR